MTVHYYGLGTLFLKALWMKVFWQCRKQLPVCVWDSPSFWLRSWILQIAFLCPIRNIQSQFATLLYKLEKVDDFSHSVGSLNWALHTKLHVKVLISKSSRSSLRPLFYSQCGIWNQCSFLEDQELTNKVKMELFVTYQELFVSLFIPPHYPDFYSSVNYCLF